MSRKIYFSDYRREIKELDQRMKTVSYGRTKLIEKRTVLFESLLRIAQKKKNNVGYWLTVSYYARLEKTYNFWEEKAWQKIKSINGDDFEKWKESYGYKHFHLYGQKIVKEMERTAKTLDDWKYLHIFAERGTALEKRALIKILDFMVPGSKEQ